MRRLFYWTFYVIGSLGALVAVVTTMLAFVAFSRFLLTYIISS